MAKETGKEPRYQPKPKDGTQECEAQEPAANWFGPSTEPQEEFIGDGIWSKDRFSSEPPKVKPAEESTPSPPKK